MIGSAELKVATRAAIAECKGIQGAAATANRADSTAGLWNNLSKPDLPPIDCALALDEIAVANGKAPPITGTMARLLGLILIEPPEGEAQPGDVLAMMGDFAVASGALHRALCLAQADGEFNDDEKRELRGLIDAAQTDLAELDAALTSGGK